MINITARNFKLTDGIVNYVNNRIGKFEKFVNGHEQINIVLESNKYGQRAEVSFKLNNKPLRASIINEDLYVAIDLLVDKVSRVIEKNSGKNSEINKYDSIKYMEYHNKDMVSKQTESNKPKIVRRKNVSSKPMFEEEAIEQMELLDHRSFIFYNASTDRISMLYKRLDGDYGILETN